MKHSSSSSSSRRKWPWLLHLTAAAALLILIAASEFADAARPEYTNNRKKTAPGLKLKLHRHYAGLSNRADILKTVIESDKLRIRQRLGPSSLSSSALRRIMQQQKTDTLSFSESTSNAFPIKRREMLQGQSSTINSTSTSLDVISGSFVGSGEYFVTIEVGTPSQSLFLIADTGSDLTWAKCDTSASASVNLPGVSISLGVSSTNQSFAPSASVTSTPLSCSSEECNSLFDQESCGKGGDGGNSGGAGGDATCEYSYSYTDQSFTSGWMFYDTIKLGKNVKQENLLLGCGRDYAGPNFDKAGGVIGLGKGPLSLASQLAARSSANFVDKFSYCLSDFFGAPSSSAGLLAFGAAALQTSVQLHYTPLMPNPYAGTFYYVGIREIHVGGNRLLIPPEVFHIDQTTGVGGTIVDSGTTLAQFVAPAYDAIVAAFRHAINLYPMADPSSIPPGLDLCYDVSAAAASSSSSPKFPELEILLYGNLLFKPPQDNYFTDAAPGVKCLAMQRSPASSFSVIGNLLQQNYHLEFDRLHNRLGFAPTNCAKLRSP